MVRYGGRICSLTTSACVTFISLTTRDLCQHRNHHLHGPGATNVPLGSTMLPARGATSKTRAVISGATTWRTPAPGSGWLPVCQEGLNASQVHRVALRDLLHPPDAILEKMSVDHRGRWRGSQGACDGPRHLKDSADGAVLQMGGEDTGREEPKVHSQVSPWGPSRGDCARRRSPGSRAREV